MLAITFGIKRLHTYLYNRPFTVLSDHKPLEMICNKPITAAPPRLQAMMLAVQDYSFIIKYVPGKDVGLADALSRLPNPENREDVKLDIRIEHVQFTSNKIKDIREATQNDPILNELKETIHSVWPEEVKSLAPTLWEFWSYRDELSVVNGIILKGESVYIPDTHRQGVLENLHTGHLGIVKTQLRASKDVFWPKINQDIEKMCKSCEVCQQYQNTQPAEPLIQTEVPSRPWSTIGTDLFQIEDDHYLITADYYSKFPLVDRIHKPVTSEKVVNVLKKYCGLLGIPDIIRSDNGPQYTGLPFVKYVEQWGIKHVTSSPRYPRSNGFIERQVGTVKAVIKKAKEANEDVDLALLRLRTTTVSSKVPRPAELLLQRRIKDTLPSKIHNKDPESDDFKEQLQIRQKTQKEYHDRQARELPPLIPGQTVTYQDVNTGNWFPAMAITKAPEPRSYLIKTTGGHILHRNRVHIREKVSATTVTR